MNPTNLSFESSSVTGPGEDLSDLSDIKLQTEDGCVFDGHRVFLARASRYFYALFQWMGKDKTEFFVPGIKGAILKTILDHIYKRTTHFTESNIYELMVWSNYLLADSVMCEIEQWVKCEISLNNCIPLYMTALKINNEDISRGSYRYIQTHFEVLVSRADIAVLTFESMAQFLGDKNLCVSGENVVWFAIVKWTQGNITNRLRYVPDFLQRLKFPEIDGSLATEILCHDIVANNNFCKDLKSIAENQSRKIRASKSTRRRRNLETNEDFKNIKILEYYMKHLVGPADLYNDRRPDRMHLVARHHYHNNKDGVQVFITYDEKLDVWRKLGETDFYPKYFFFVGRSVYIFGDYSQGGMKFNIFEKQWQEIPEFANRYSSLLVNHNRLIYEIGGKWEESLERVMEVDRCTLREGDDDFDWMSAPSMNPIESYSAVVFQNSIYVVGNSRNDRTMIAQYYNRRRSTWAMLPPPGIFRFDFALVVYHEKLYIAGGSSPKKEDPSTLTELIKNVERFDFDRKEWEAIEDLPHTYYKPKAIVLNDRLIVFEDSKNLPSYLRKNPPVQWSETGASWELLDDKSLASNDLSWYHFHTVNDSRLISKLVRENKDPRSQLEKSPFN